MHNRHLLLESSPSWSSTALATSEAFHWQKALGTFNKVLSAAFQPSSTPLTDTERIAIWGTSMILGALAFCHLDARTPEEAWPLAPASDLDLNWLRLSEGKTIMMIMKLAAPLLTQAVMDTYHLPLIGDMDLRALPIEMVQLCNLCPEEEAVDEGSSESESCNTYFQAAALLARILRSNDHLSNLQTFWTFTMHMQPDFRRKLEEKDPPALLILAYWYAKVCQSRHWWLLRRARLEGLAICGYLEGVWVSSGYTASLGLLRWPRLTCKASASGNDGV